jgi:predicted secreted protein
MIGPRRRSSTTMNIKASHLLAACAIFGAAGSLTAQTLPAYPPPQNVLQLQASGSVEVQQDLLTMNLTTAREGTDPAVVQGQLKTALDAALAEARKTAQPGQMDVRTGNFAIYPRHNRDGKLSGWTGTAELVLEGRDFPRITQAAARIQTLTMGGVHFGLSREQRAKVETDAQSIAIERFKAKAAELAKNFGFTGYTLREVAVQANDPGFGPVPRMASMQAKSMEASVPVEAGKSTVTVTVSGTVQLR